MSNKLTIMGCRAGAPAQGIAASGYVLEVDGTTLLIDCGPGVVLELSRSNLIDRLDAVVITHRHADHCADLLALAYYCLFPTAQAPLPLFGPPDLWQVLDTLNGLFGIPTLPTLTTPLTTAFTWSPIVPGTSFAPLGITTETLPTQHPVPTMALRWPALGLVYTSDSALIDPLVVFATQAHTLIAEATYATPQGHDLSRHGHMAGVQAGMLAHTARVGRLGLTHLADYAVAEATAMAAATCYAGPVTVLRPGLVIELEGDDK